MLLRLLKENKINVKRIHQIEVVKHDVIAFTWLLKKLELSKILHQGMTSSDVLDTSFNIQLVQSENFASRS